MIYYRLFLLMSVIFVLLFTRKMSFLLVYFFSSIVFYFPAILGKVYYGNNMFYLEPKTYIVLAINLLLTISIHFVFQKKDELEKIQKKSNNNDRIIRTITKLVTIIIFVTMLYYFYYMKDAMFGRVYDKRYLMNMTPKSLEYYMYFLTFWNIFIFTEESKSTTIEKLTAVICLVFTFLLGIRSFIVIVFTGILISFIEKNLDNNTLIYFLKKNKKIILIVICTFLIVIYVKGVYSAFFAGDINYVKKSLNNKEYYIDEIKYSEPNVITRNLDFIVMYNYKQPQISYLQILKLIIPGMTKITGYNFSFSDNYQSEIYGIKNTNNASTFIGEAYANGGILVVFIVILIFCFVLHLLWKAYKFFNNEIIKAFFLTIGSDLSFYICRNDAAYAFMRIRYYCYGLLLLLILIWFIRVIYKKNQSN